MMDFSARNVSVVIPCFNEYNRLDIEYWTQIINHLNHVNWIFVDDGSSDKTLDLLRSLQSNSNVEVLARKDNAGKSEAIRYGMSRVLTDKPNSELIAYIDSDGAFSLSDIENLLDIAIEDLRRSVLRDAWISSRVNLAGRSIQRRASRHYIGRLIATFVTFGWKNAPYDTQSGFKVFANSEEFRECLDTKLRTRWFFDIEILARISITKCKPVNVWEVPLFTWRDVNGSHIGFGQYYQILRDIFIARQTVKEVKRIECEAEIGFN